MVARVDPDDGEPFRKPLLLSIGIAAAALVVLALLTLLVRTIGVSVDEDLGERIEAAAIAADGEPVALQGFTDFAWSRACLIPPGASPDVIEARYGYGWTHALRDDAVTVIFAAGTEIVRQTHLSPRLAEMPPTDGDCTPAGDAEISFRSP